MGSTPSGVAKVVVRISPHYKGRNGSLVPIGHKGRFVLFENSKNGMKYDLNRAAN